MIEKPTVFILGAGASQPMGFPTGNELFTLVCNSLSGTDVPQKLHAYCGFDPNQILQFQKRLQNSGKSSVDAFLEYREDFMEIGKAAMAHELILLEDSPRLFNSYVGAWYKYLFDKMDNGLDTFGENKVSFLTFNYDRSLEEFLFQSLTNLYGEPNEDRAATIAKCTSQLKRIPIVHLHGKLGNLPWEGGAERPFEPTINAQTLNIARNGIKIIHEKVDGSRDQEFKFGHDLLQAAEKVYLLGFGYSKVNMERLRIIGPDAIEFRTLQGSNRAVGTAFGMTDGERADLRRTTRGRIDFFPMDCLAAIKELQWVY